jgi:hypothetical protein
VTFITLPCGCRLTAASVLGMCLKHVGELRRLELESWVTEIECWQCYEKRCSAHSAGERRD